MAWKYDNTNGIIIADAVGSLAVDCVGSLQWIAVERICLVNGATPGSWTIKDGTDNVLGPATYYTLGNEVLTIPFDGRFIDGFKLTALPGGARGCMIHIKERPQGGL
jgi:hypothetical protein